MKAVDLREPASRVPNSIPLEWTEPVSLEVALQQALRSTQECAAACLAIVPELPKGVHGPVAVIGAVSVAAERLEEEHHDRAAALAICVRIIDASLASFDEVGSSPEALRAGRAAHRCADLCRRALAALYLSQEEL
jgi:hypothetical protein